MRRKRSQSQVLAMIRRLQKQCGLEMWSFDLIIEKPTEESEKKNVGAYIEVNLEYRRGTIHLYSDQLNISERGLMHNLRHELIHCITAMKEEAQVEHINNLINRYEERATRLRKRLRSR